tara:strand:+ start:93 stop:287 length:195 start_codon:yes stop_codon:yes gene_type:complete
LEALYKSVLVSRRVNCAEIFSKERMEQFAMKILARVGCDFSENEKCRKSKVSLAIYVSQGLVST